MAHKIEKFLEKLVHGLLMVVVVLLAVPVIWEGLSLHETLTVLWFVIAAIFVSELARIHKAIERKSNDGNP